MTTSDDANNWQCTCGRMNTGWAQNCRHCGQFRYSHTRTSDDKTSLLVRPMTKLLSIPEGTIDE